MNLLRRFRLRSIREQMLFIAVLALLISLPITLTRRADAFRRLAFEHQALIIAPGVYGDRKNNIVRWACRDGTLLAERPRQDWWHEELFRKYLAAASEPWLPVPPDPPRPNPGDPLSDLELKKQRVLSSIKY